MIIKKFRGILKSGVRGSKYFVEGIRQSDQYKAVKRAIYEKIRESYKRATELQFNTLTAQTLDLAKSNIREAISIARSEGILNVFKPRLLVAIFTTSAFNIVPIMFAILCFSLLTYILFYTMVIPIYGTYTFAAAISFLIDIPLSIANAILFGINAIFQAIQAGVAFILNGFAKVFLKPIVDTINGIIRVIRQIIDGINFIVSHIPFIGGSVSISKPGELSLPQLEITVSTAPPVVFSYLTPPDDIKYTATGDVDLLHFFNFKMVKPGPVYTDKYNTFYVSKLSFFGRQKMVIKIPKLRDEVISNSFLTTPLRGEKNKMTPTPDVKPITAGLSFIFTDSLNQTIQNINRTVHNLIKDPLSTVLTGDTTDGLRKNDPNGDADHDGVPNKDDVNPINPFEKRDSDNDGTPDRIDKNPTNPNVKGDKRNFIEQAVDTVTYGLWCFSKVIVDAASMAAAPIISFFV